MSESKQTVGPWTVEVEACDKDNERGGTFVVQGRVCIAVCDASSILSKSQITANAHLISAAPDLLLSIEKIMARISAENLIGYFTNDELNFIVNAHKKAVGDLD